MPTEMFLRFEGPDIPGESRADGHEGEIDVIAWEWLQSNAASPVAGGGQAGRVQVENLAIVKRVDRATPLLSLANASGMVFGGAVLANRRPNDLFDYLVIDLKRVIVTQVGIDAESDDPALEETIRLAFAEFTLTYTPQNPDGSAGTPITRGWNIESNSEAG